MGWINAMEQLPQPGQQVWYYGRHLGVWWGRYEFHPDALVSPHQFICGESPGSCDRMDAPWWMPAPDFKPTHDDRPLPPAE
jgi:hypothetical protein